MKSPQQCLSDALCTFQERNKNYGGGQSLAQLPADFVDPESAYLKYGPMMMMMMSNQNPQSWGAQDWQRFGVLSMIVSKITRYAANMDKGGHQDSAHDLIAYAAILESLTP